MTLYTLCFILVACVASFFCYAKGYIDGYNNCYRNMTNNQ